MMRLGSVGHPSVLPGGPSKLPVSSPALLGPEGSHAGISVLCARPSGIVPPTGSWAASGFYATAVAVGFAVARASRSSGRGGHLSRCAASRRAADHEAPSPALSRAGLLRSLGSAGVSSLVPALAPAPALAKSLGEAQAALTTFGHPELAPTEGPPFGWGIVVEPVGFAPDANFGKTKVGGSPQVVTFFSPPLWVISKPTIDFNGATGTLSANDYNKGDSATLWVDTGFKGSLADFKKADYFKTMQKALTTKGVQFVEKLKIVNVKDGAPGYKLCEYTWEIETGAGFFMPRHGYSSFTQVGDNLQVFWSGTLQPRWDQRKGDLDRMIQSFRLSAVPKSISKTMEMGEKRLDQEVTRSDLPKIDLYN